MSVTATVLNGITHVISTLGYPGIVFWMTLESACVPVPSFVIMPFAGKLIVTDHHFNIYVLTVMGALGNLIGSMLAYWVGAAGGRPFIEKYGKYLLISESDIDAGDRWFKKYGDATAFVSRLLPVVRTFISLPAGISRMNFGRFCVFTFLGALPYCYALTYAGVKLGEHWEEASKVMHKADDVIIVTFILFAGLWFYRHFRSSRPAPAKA